MDEFQTVDELPPVKIDYTKRRTAGARNTKGSRFAAFLRDNPEQWAIYPGTGNAAQAAASWWNKQPHMSQGGTFKASRREGVGYMQYIPNTNNQ